MVGRSEGGNGGRSKVGMVGRLVEKVRKVSWRVKRYEGQRMERLEGWRVESSEVGTVFKDENLTPTAN